MTSRPAAEGFAPDALTCDGFLGGRLQVFQPRAGYRAAMDPVFMAAAVPAKPGEQVLELGCGAGVASLCLAARVQGVVVTGVERQPAYSDLARRNAAANASVCSVPLEVVEADLAALPPDLRQRSFDHVMANPPYFFADGGTPAADSGREAALREETPLSLWIETGLRRLRPGGWITIIQMTERLPEVLTALQGPAGAISVLPIAAREGRAAGRVLVQARKGARTPFRLLPPFVVHTGTRHEADEDTHTAAARSVLREGAAICLRDGTTSA